MAGGESAGGGAALHGTAGALASMLSMLLLYPLDQVRVIQQRQGAAGDKVRRRTPLGTFCHVLHEEGLQGLYRGVLGTLQTVGISYFVYFFVYNGCKTLLRRALQGRQLHRTLQDLAASTLGGVINVLLTCPLWVAATRLKFLQQGGPEKADPPPGLWRTLLRILRTEGLGALWRGTSSSLILVSNPILQFTAYDGLKRAQLQLRESLDASAASTLRPMEALLLGGASKLLATFATYPLQVAQTLQRTERKDTGALATLLALARTRGASALFAGLGSKLLQTVATAALMFMFYERLVAACLRLGTASRLRLR